MHLLQAQAGDANDAVEPVNTGQTPADIVVIASADTDLACLAGARAALDAAGEAPSLRLARLDWFAHPFSVDAYLDAVATRSRLVVARVLGGAPYWTYGLEQFALRLRSAGVAFAALPGDDKPDAELAAASTVAPEDAARLAAYLAEGGPENAVGFLRHARHLIGDGPEPPEARPVLRAGLYWPGATDAGAAMRAAWIPGRPTAAYVFYRAHLLGGGLEPADRMIRALDQAGLNPLPIFVASLKEAVSAATLARFFEETPPDVVLNATAFAVGAIADQGVAGAGRSETPLDAPGRPVLQVVYAAGSEAAWADGARGLSARDVAMHVALPEVDGRVLTRAVAFKDEAYRDDACQCPIPTLRPQAGRIAFVADLAAAWTRLARTPLAERRIALVFANYPTKDGRIANGVGLDAPASAVAILDALAAAGYAVADAPGDAAALMRTILAGPTNAPDALDRAAGARLSLADYRAAFAEAPHALRESVEDRWGAPETDRRVEGDAFRLSIHRLGNVVLGVQPARGYDVDPAESFHSPDLPPTHAYLAFYVWLRRAFRAHAVVHLGKHGNLEWLPGKALALSDACAPEAALGSTPHLYPFIVNDPGEGAQAKRRAQAVVVDHLTPPMTRAETYGPLREIEALLDEFYEAQTVDPRRADHLRREILSRSAVDGLALDAGAAGGDAADEDETLRRVDAYLCELKESQIRDGLHVFGRAPAGRLETDLVVSLARAPRAQGRAGDASLIRALSADLLGPIDRFDPLDCDMAAPWSGDRPAALAAASPDVWRSAGDTVERLELLAATLVAGDAAPEPEWTATRAVLDEIEARVRPAVRASGAAEIDALLAGLDGRFVPPGPSGAPTRGRLDVLPTGRNFYSVDSRALPTRAAWALGWASACRLLERHLQEEGDWPKAIALTAWGTANMRTGGDDVAQGLALMGVRPTWDDASSRVSGYEVLPPGVLGRPRVDVTLRVSGFFRDAFPAQLDLFDAAARAVLALDEAKDVNPGAARRRAEEAAGAEAWAAGARVFGSKPGAYGAGLQALIDEGGWTDRADFAEAYLAWGGYAYGGASGDGTAARAALESRLAQVDAVLQNQDNREHDVLDSDDYYQFEGGLSATVETLRGAAPKIYHGDHSRPERPVIRTLDEEIGRVVRARAANPKWLAGVMRHGYKGAFEIAATIDYLFAFAATTNAVADRHFDLVYDATLGDPAVRAFMAEANAPALAETQARFQEAVDRGLWTPRRNSTAADLMGGDVSTDGVDDGAGDTKRSL